MFEEPKASAQRFRRAQPGTRFQQQYQTQQRSDRPAWVKPLWIGLGLVIIAAGGAALPLPGPGSLVIAIGGALLARELEFAARGLDRLEVRIRSAATWAERAWKRSAASAKAGIVALGVVLAVGSGYLAWIWFLRDRCA